MIGFYAVVFIATFCSLPFMPFLIASAIHTYQATPEHRMADRSWKLGHAISWSIWTIVFVILMLWSALGLKDSIFSLLGYLC